MGGYSTDWSSSRDYNWSRDNNVTRRSSRDYTRDDNRNYTGSRNGAVPTPGDKLKTDSQLAAVMVVDVTGSMGKWPSLIFEKIPALYNETNVALQGLDPDELAAGNKTADSLLELAVLAVGDYKHDRFPIQVVNFSKGPDLVNGVNKIHPEGGGGGNAKESYDLSLYYILNHCEMPNIPQDFKPPLIIAGDEGFYTEVSKDVVKRYIGDDLAHDLKTEDVIRKLMQKFDVYILRPEGDGYPPIAYQAIRHQWNEVLGSQRVMLMSDPERLVDCVIGICAYSADHFQIGEKLLERRQTPRQVQEVMKILHPLLEKDKERE